MFVIRSTAANAKLEPLSDYPEWVNESVHVLDGDFYDKDAATDQLVDLVLGLWAFACLELSDRDISALTRSVLGSKETVFPRKYFGGLIDILETELVCLRSHVEVDASSTPKINAAVLGKDKVHKQESSLRREISRSLSKKVPKAGRKSTVYKPKEESELMRLIQKATGVKKDELLGEEEKQREVTWDLLDAHLGDLSALTAAGSVRSDSVRSEASVRPQPLLPKHRRRSSLTRLSRMFDMGGEPSPAQAAQQVDDRNGAPRNGAPTSATSTWQDLSA
jgi:hypothetical protein